jgi:PAS domain S-box-containing protein
MPAYRDVWAPMRTTVPGVHLSPLRMPGTYTPTLVGLSIAIAMLASFVALELATRVAATRGRIRLAWLFAGASVMGIGIWSMHFTGMLAFHLTTPVFYDVFVVLLSLVAAIAASTVAFAVVVRPELERTSLAAAAVVMGAAIGTMHYSGLAAIRVDASMTYRPAIVVASLLIAVLVSYAALWLAFHFRGDNSRTGQWRRAQAAVFMGLAIAGMHHTGMLAVRFGAPNETFVLTSHHVVAAPQLAPILVAASLLLLGLVLALAVADRQLRLKGRLLEADIARRQEERLRAFYDVLTCGVIVRGANGLITYANQAALKMLPYSPESIAGASPQPEVELHDESGHPLAADAYPSAIARQSRQAVRGSLVGTRGTDGGELWLLCDAVPVIDPVTAAVGDVILSLVDVTERRRIEQALRESEERFRTMVDSLADGIVLQLADFSIATCNASAERITGLGADQMLGRRPRPEGWLAIREDGSRFDLRQHPSIVALISGRAASCMLGVRSTGRDTRWISINTRPLFHAGSAKPYAALSSIIDVTDRVTAQEAERRAREAAEAASRAKSDFLANMSHEIRTPMNGVLGMLELVLGNALDPTQREYLEVAQSSAESLLEVINEILDFSKVEAGRLELRPEPFSLSDCLGGALDPMGPRAAQKGIELALRIAPGMPPILVGDAVRLRQVITNLVGNAVKFTERGEIVLTAEMEPVDDPTTGVVVHFAVLDTGMGIPKDKQELIFDAFTQADTSATRSYSGTGLGLAISTRLVHLMGGRLWVDSVEHQGSTFHFTARFATRSVLEPTDDVPHEELRGATVLVVDDNGTNRLILHEMLTSWEMRPTAVGSAFWAIEAMEKAERAGTPYRLLLVDGYMPDMDGFTLVERLRENPRFAGATVLMLTSADGDGGPERCRALGVVAHLLKPIKSRDLRVAISRALGQSPRAPAVPPADILDGRSAHPARLLLAEDNLVNQKLAVAVLARWGHTIEVAGDGKAALAAVARERFDLILMDVQMPTMDGLRATMEIRASEKHTGGHIPIIAMTARTMAGDRERCLEAGMDGYVSKPFDLEELFSVLEPILARAAARRTSSGNSLSAVRGGAPRRSGETRAIPSRVDVVDGGALMTAVAGDRRLLRELVELLRTEGPRRLTDLRVALAKGDALGVEAAAHSLKGSVGSLKAKRSYDAAQAVEALARRGEMSGVEAACAVLEEEIAHLQRALATFVGAA